MRRTYNETYRSDPNESRSEGSVSDARQWGRSRRSSRWLKVLLGLMVLGGAGFGYYWFCIPSTAIAERSTSLANPIVYQGKVYEVNADVDGETIRIPLSFLHEQMGLVDQIRYEESSGTAVLTNAARVMRMQTSTLEGYVNRSPITLRETVKVEADNVLVPTAALEQLLGLKTERAPESGYVTLLPAESTVQRGLVVTDSAIRSGASIREPIVEKVTQGTDIRVYASVAGTAWFRVQGSSGFVGYLEAKHLELNGMEQIAPLSIPPFKPWNRMGNRINMTWEAVYRSNPDVTTLGALEGVNVVSPTWFELLDGSGNISSKFDASYATWARLTNRQLWPVFSNSFEPQRTSAALAQSSTRFTMIQQLAAYVQAHNLQGINLDFENVYTKDKENYVQFVRELTPVMHEMNVVVSVDITPKSSSEMWSLFLDRPKLAAAADYVILMGYDEHWAASPTAGSVASLPWVEKSINVMLEEERIPASRLILGVPMYTRQWTETVQQDGSVKVTSKSKSMNDVAEIIHSRQLTPKLDPATGQNYIEYKDDAGNLNRIWMEDALSMTKRIHLIRNYDLAGISSWSRGFASDEIWSTIAAQLNVMK